MESNLSKNQTKRNISTDFIIRVLPKEGISLSGKVEHLQSGQVQRFSDYLELIILIQKKLDQLGVPQPGTKFRSW